MKKNQTTSMISSCVVELPIGRFELKGDESYLLSCQKTSKKCSPATTSLLKKASLELKEFFEGNRQTFSIPLSFDSGTTFQQIVWKKLYKLSYGKTLSYGELAKKVGRGGASRAVGTANAKNPLCFFVPCHRVIRSDGSIGQYSAGGEKAKRYILELEKRNLKN